MVTSWILNSISKELVDGFIYTASARDLWLEICERFGECNRPMIYELHRKISLISQENASVSVYFTKLKRLWDELRYVETLPTCICGASRAIADVTNRNRLMQFLMGLNEVFGSVREQVLGMDPLPTVNKAYSMVVKFESQREILGAMNDNTESLALLNKTQYQNLNRPRRSENKKGHCTFCNMNGHTREGCFKLIGYPDWFKGKNKVGTQPVKDFRNTKIMAAIDGNKPEEDSPLECLDTSNRILELSSMLSSLKQEVSQLTKGKGILGPSTSHGPGPHFMDFADGKTTQVSQSGKLNLFGKLILDDVLYVPHFQYNLISDPLNKKVVTIGKKQRGLFRINQMSFSYSDIRHCLLEIMKSNAENQFDTVIKVIRTDNGKEFLSHNYRSLLMNKGIIHQRSCPYTPQQNGVVERKHRHILDTARALKMQSNVPIEFWLECILTATYLINRMPMEHFDWTTPYERLYGRSPNYSHLRKFGCLCFATSVRTQKDKFQERPVKAVMVGYANTHKAYKLYNMNDKSFFVSRDVIFHENFFSLSRD
ncbi:uncharacterized protein LOC110603210 [Manihot esculenta]|uniref:uncharacterized protein LOC110603210 n=1 Tax=Manihot esculenta TaxID=3983 RepID=UPI000B5D3526|nr:uncharacterized protein LOC110603210 [Manihot esculenta]